MESWFAGVPLARCQTERGGAMPRLRCPIGSDLCPKDIIRRRLLLHSLALSEGPGRKLELNEGRERDGVRDGHTTHESLPPLATKLPPSASCQAFLL